MVVFVGLLLAAGVYVLVTTPAQAAPAAAPPASETTSFGFALAAGAIALAATLMVARPKLRMRR
ncbi:MAG TPA: hypothetical protein VM370_13585 [Candidatus Thermoplasmatota archaeon]|nr:hypothetical protein [Candidatus Thermoplasmatota archaeon]